MPAGRQLSHEAGVRSKHATAQEARAGDARIDALMSTYGPSARGSARRCPSCGSHYIGRARHCEICGAALPWRHTPAGVVGESLLALLGVLIVVGGLMALRARGGPGLAPEEAVVAQLIDEAPTPAPTFTRAPASTSTVAPPTVLPDAPAATGIVTYTIASGDTLSGIAQQFDVGTDELVAANPDTLGRPDALRIGELVTVPVAPPAAAGAPPAEAALQEAPAATDPTAGVPAAAVEVDAALSAMLGVPIAPTPDPDSGEADVPGASALAGADPLPAESGASAQTGPRSPLPSDSILSINNADLAAASLRAPWPIAPAEAASVAGESPVLRWSSVGVLPAGAHYVIELRDADDPQAGSQLVWILSNATAARVPGDLRPPLGTSKRFVWTVSVRGRTGKVVGDDPGLLIGRASPERTFDWLP